MANGPNVIIPRIHKADSGFDPLDAAAEEAARQNKVPLRIKCPECEHIYILYVEDLNQGLYTLLGQACPRCKRFLKESDDPEKILVDLKEIREMTKEETK